MKLARSEGQFLCKFNSQFEVITSKGISELNLMQKYLIARFTFKLGFITALYQHHIVKEHLPESMEVGEIVSNLAD